MPRRRWALGSAVRGRERRRLRSLQLRQGQERFGDRRRRDRDERRRAGDRVRAGERRVCRRPAPARPARRRRRPRPTALFLHPSLYWIPNRIPQLGLGRTVFTTDFPLESPTRFLTALGAEVLPRLQELTRARTANATALDRGAAHDSGPAVRRASEATPCRRSCRLPVLLPDPGTRDRALAALTRAGIGASRSYPASLADVPELQRWSVLRRGRRADDSWPQRILTLPTHPFVSADDISRTAAVLRGELEGLRYRKASPAA